MSSYPFNKKLIILIFTLLFFIYCNDNRETSYSIISSNGESSKSINRFENSSEPEKYDLQLPRNLSRKVNLIIINEIDDIFGNMLNNIINKFKNKEPNINISIYSYQDVKRVHLNPFSFSSDKDSGYADILISYSYNIKEWKTMRYIFPCNPLGVNQTEFFDSSIADVYINSNLWAMPLFGHKLSLLFYNKKYMENVPQSLDKLPSNVKLYYPVNDPLYLIPFVIEAGIKDAKTIEDFVNCINKSAENIRKLEDSGSIVLSNSFSNEHYDIQFREGKLETIINGDWCIKPYQQELGNNLGISSVQPIKEKGLPLSFFAEFKYIFLSSTNSNDLEKLLAISIFLRYLQSEEIQTLITTTSTLTTPMKKHLKSNKLTSFELVRIKSLSESVTLYNESYKEALFGLIKKYLIPLIKMKDKSLTIDIVKKQDIPKILNICNN